MHAYLNMPRPMATGDKATANVEVGTQTHKQTDNQTKKISPQHRFISGGGIAQTHKQTDWGKKYPPDSVRCGGHTFFFETLIFQKLPL